MARTIRGTGNYKLPSEEQRDLRLRGGGKGFHGGNKRQQARRDRQSSRQALRGGQW